MTTATASQEHIGETKAVANHDHDIIHELSKRLDAIWRYDQYIANASGHPEIEALWRNLKDQDQQNVNELKRLIKSELERDCF